jgi:hypothetical protein
MGYASGRAPERPVLWNPEIVEPPLPSFPLIRIIVTLFSAPRESSLIKSKKIRKPGEGSLHPQPEGRGIRDPLRSRCNKILVIALYYMGVEGLAFLSQGKRSLCIIINI